VEHVFAALAAGVVLAHVAFVVFAVLGGFLATARRWVVLLHLPCVAWAAWVEFSGSICPLTPLEQALRARAGLAPYAGDFIARYVFPLLYPQGLTRQAQIVIGIIVLAVNAIAYGRLLQRRLRGRRAT
jgi:uncharacterized protein DUF2784